MTVRMLESLVRCTQAHAKLHLQPLCTLDDAAFAIFLMERSAHSLKCPLGILGEGVYSSLRELDDIFLSDTQECMAQQDAVLAALVHTIRHYHRYSRGGGGGNCHHDRGGGDEEKMQTTFVRPFVQKMGNMVVVVVVRRCLRQSRVPLASARVTRRAAAETIGGAWATRKRMAGAITILRSIDDDRAGAAVPTTTTTMRTRRTGVF